MLYTTMSCRCLWEEHCLSDVVYYHVLESVCQLCLNDIFSSTTFSMALFSVVIFSRCRNLLLSNRANNIFLSCAHFLSNTGSHDLRIVNVAKRLPLFLAAEGNFGRTAIFDRLGQFMYDDVFHLSTCLSKDLLELHGVSKDRTLDQARVGYVCENDVSFLVTTFAVWMCNGICVPLCKTHPIKELEYFVRDSGCSLLVSSAGFADKMNSLAQQVCVPLRVIGDSEMTGSYSVNQWLVSDSATSDRRRGKARKARPKRWFDLALFNNDFKTKPAMLIYTSGTTGRPKVGMAYGGHGILWVWHVVGVVYGGRGLTSAWHMVGVAWGWCGVFKHRFLSDVIALTILATVDDSACFSFIIMLYAFCHDYCYVYIKILAFLNSGHPCCQNRPYIVSAMY